MDGPNENEVLEDDFEEANDGWRTRSSHAKRSGSWKPWEDRALIKEIMGGNVLSCCKDKTEEKWIELADGIKETGSIRT